jgi:arylsulfatase A-like enzyme
MDQSRTPEGAGPRRGAGRPLSRRAFLRQATGIGGGLLMAGLGAGLRVATARAAAKPNIILLTADSLRADHMGAYGYARPTTPHLDRLAAESVRFEYAFAPISFTVPSLASLHTGKYPREHFMQLKNGNADFQHTDPALAARLKAHGYQTAAFVSNLLLERARSQMDKGFIHYDDTLPDKRKEGVEIWPCRTAPETTAAVLQWLKTQAKPPFFLWVHYIEPHGPYAPPPPYDTLFVGDPLYRAEPRLLELSPEQLAGALVAKRWTQGEGVKVTPRMITYLDAERDSEGKVLHYNPRVADHIARYDGEIRGLDEAVGHLLQALKTQGLYDTAWLLFSSDHGESLGEHGYYFQHGYRVTLELLHVPLLIKPPGARAPRRISTQVGLIDLMPTLLEAAGSAVPRGLSGQSILPLVRGERPSGSRLVFSERGIQYSLIDDRYQLLMGYDGPTFDEKGLKRLILELNVAPMSLFAYRADPVGARDLAGEERAAAKARFRQLHAFVQGYLQRIAQAPRITRPPVQDSAQTREILKQLGY